MRYRGKLVGLIVGFLTGRFIGLLIGVFIGHLIDTNRLPFFIKRFFNKEQERTTLFFRTTFEVMGHLTKAKGRVTETDIRVVSAFMDKMQLHGQSRINAQHAFRDGKRDNYPLKDKLRELKSLCFGRSDLIQIFLEIQIQVVFSDGTIHPNEQIILYTIAQELGFSQKQFTQFINMMSGGQHFEQESRQRDNQHHSPFQRKATVDDAYKVLGIEPDSDITTIKRAYRKLMNEHHPDKLLAKGLPPEMISIAKQKTQEIQAAYDLVKQQKQFK